MVNNIDVSWMKMNSLIFSFIIKSDILHLIEEILNN